MYHWEPILFHAFGTSLSPATWHNTVHLSALIKVSRKAFLDSRCIMLIASVMLRAYLRQIQWVCMTWLAKLYWMCRFLCCPLINALIPSLFWRKQTICFGWKTFFIILGNFTWQTRQNNIMNSVTHHPGPTTMTFLFFHLHSLYFWRKTLDIRVVIHKCLH